MRIEKLHKLQEVFNWLEKWEDSLLALEDATEQGEEEDISSYIQDVEESRLYLLHAWRQLKFELQKEKEMKDVETNG